MMAVDILPTALPREASEHFSSVLGPYLRSVIRGYRQSSGREESAGKEEALERATVASGGQLREGHLWLEDLLAAWRAQDASSSSPGAGSVKRKRVLMLGSGMVAKPAIDEIVRRGDVELIVGESDMPFSIVYGTSC